MICRLIVLFLATAFAQRYNPPPSQPGNAVPILSQNYQLNPDGSYQFSYETGDGTGRSESGVPRAPGPEGLAVVAEGNFKYNLDDGPVAVNYVANEYGYQPTGDRVHPSIQKAVAYLVAEAQKNPQGAAAQQSAVKPSNFFGRK
uniref:Endocuticle structural glycoprotein SgAbd-9 n=1 Tax=Clastoptera arizonana TaxID=38151 RepID=A0A1B6C9I8_9HEMI